MKNKNLIIFIGVGFIISVIIWGFVGGCGSVGVHKKATPPLEGPTEAEGVILEETSMPSSGNVCIVEAGDTLWGISRRYEVSVSAIKEANNLTKDTIAVGQRLVIPGGERSSGQPVVASEAVSEVGTHSPLKDVPEGLVVYKVRKGDSLWRIGQIHGITIEKIAELNDMSKDASLVPGQEILVPEKK